MSRLWSHCIPICLPTLVQYRTHSLPVSIESQCLVILKLDPVPYVLLNVIEPLLVMVQWSFHQHIWLMEAGLRGCCGKSRCMFFHVYYSNKVQKWQKSMYVLIILYANLTKCTWCIFLSTCNEISMLIEVSQQCRFAHIPLPQRVSGKFEVVGQVLLIRL